MAARIGGAVLPPRFLAFLLLLVLGTVGWGVLFPAHVWQDRLAMGFDLAASLMLLSLVPLLGDHGAVAMRRRSAGNDANRALVLVLTTVVTLVVLAAVTVELKGARAGNPLAIARLVITLALIWLFGNSTYMLHYAHAFYAPDGKSGDAGGITFPGTPHPSYSDFAYFAFTLGMTFQTSDVEITAPALRRAALLHCIAAFVFNIGVIAFSINALGGA